MKVENNFEEGKNRRYSEKERAEDSPNEAILGRVYVLANVPAQLFSLA